MNEEEFRDLVKEMRRVQKLYFKFRDRSVMIESKRLESEVDRELAPPPLPREAELWGTG